MDANAYDCAICHELLHDPVVGSCGHDACKRCLELWISLQAEKGRPFTCPQCRQLIADGSSPQLGVCVRLKSTILSLFPERAAKRQLEVEALQRGHAAEQAASQARQLAILHAQQQQQQQQRQQQQHTAAADGGGSNTGSIGLLGGAGDSAGTNAGDSGSDARLLAVSTSLFAAERSFASAARLFAATLRQEHASIAPQRTGGNMPQGRGHRSVAADPSASFVSFAERLQAMAQQLSVQNDAIGAPPVSVSAVLRAAAMHLDAGSRSMPVAASPPTAAVRGSDDGSSGEGDHERSGRRQRRRLLTSGQLSRTALGRLPYLRVRRLLARSTATPAMVDVGSFAGPPTVAVARLGHPQTWRGAARGGGGSPVPAATAPAVWATPEACNFVVGWAEREAGRPRRIGALERRRQATGAGSGRQPRPVPQNVTRQQ